MLLGLPVEYIYIVTNISLYYAVWNHSGYMLNNKYLARIFVTPQAHAIHHEKSQKYIDILRDTGRMTAEDLVMKHLGEDITKPEFWLKSIKFVTDSIAALR